MTAALRVVLTGATGFVGSRVLHALTSTAQDTGREIAIRALGRSAAAPASASAGVTWTPVDLTDRASLRKAASGADVLIHLASRISGDEAQCAAVNVEGTTALVDEAVHWGVDRIVHLSTAAVYGPGPHRGLAVNEIAPAPVSPASRTRLTGETPVLAAGGTVLRPGLILGAGDRWVVPALAELLDRVPARWDGGRGLLSMVDVDDLAGLIATLATSPDAPPPGIHHASHPDPVSNGALLKELAALDILPAPQEDWPWDACVSQLQSNPGRVSERQFSLLAQDHWYASEDIWHTTSRPPGPGPLSRLTPAAPWYRAYLANRNT
ncbi:NAD(P)-dependent oxidoreductase [Streptomyces sp. P9(2023)]|uniref:NAD-dependent epimerase/dehydratase family protein n=1 Tax=Streptomyces sp. P9(2023) TaxID=3064394 RepID=UPI0028F3F3EB|nr:NAD(P)-dependent oxidoreductase [Streptomyces sp. P9(2023)]MDT9690275.1 NAD(P)-dependent oxidoreductase [Streptomyces sp. P9(2023)]